MSRSLARKCQNTGAGSVMAPVKIEEHVLGAREPGGCPRLAFSCGLGEETAQDRYNLTALALGAGRFCFFPLRNRHGLLELRIAFHTPKNVDRHAHLRVPTTCDDSRSRARRLPALHECQVLSKKMGRRRHNGKPPGPSTDRQGATDHNLTTGSGNGARHRSRRPSWALWERRAPARRRRLSYGIGEE